MAKVTLSHITKYYPKHKNPAADDVCVEIQDKEFVVLVGPSGCGKSTLLRMIAGLEEITEGEIYIGDKLINDVEPKDRDIAMVFQNYALYPHMNVFDNMAFGLKMRKEPKDQIDIKVRKAAEILEITEYLNRKPKELSGGQRQRVAIGRAIVRRPQVFLMDEPLSNLDAKLRSQMRTELIKLSKELDTTFIYVTHDQAEAMTLGDRIIVLKDGAVMQVGTPKEVFETPNCLFVATFIGTPQMNVLYTDVLNCTDQKDVIVGIRPEHIYLDPAGVEAKVEVCELMGSTINLHVNCKGERLIVSCDTPKENPKMGDMVRISVDRSKVHLFDKTTEKRIN